MATINKDSGMCIPCSVRSTPDKGLGVFCEAVVEEGAKVWRHVPGQYEVLDEQALKKILSESSQEEAVKLLVHIVSMEEFPKHMIRFFDEGALINHSEQPNVTRKPTDDYRVPVVVSIEDVSKALEDKRFDLVAACDLSPGQELLMDYNVEPDDPEYFEKACEKFGVNWDWM